MSSDILLRSLLAIGIIVVGYGCVLAVKSTLVGTRAE